MVDEPFLTALRDITAGRADLSGLIDAAVRLGARGESGLAEELYRVWVGFNRDHPQAFVAHFNCAVLQSNAGDLAAAEDSLTRALAQAPDFHPAHINLASVLERQGAFDRALAEWRQVVDRLAPITGSATEHKLTALKQIGRVLIDHQRSAAAEATLGQCLEIRPKQREVLEQFVALRLGQCEWPAIAPWENVDRETLLGGASPLSLAAYTDDPMLQLAAASHYIELAVEEEPPTPDADRRKAPIDCDLRRIRVGYVSSDLRDHAIGYLMAEIFELHDRSKFEVFVYYCGPDPTGALNARIRAVVDHWIDINALDDAAAARHIARDGIDILVDVNGLTRFARTGVFARRPAPVQVNWLGFPGSIGSPYHHYIIADPWIIPPESEIFYSEAVLRLACYQPNDRKRAVVAHRPTRADVGLPEEAFVFCCFNGTQKFTPATFDRWLEILNRTSGAVLWLLEAAPEISDRLRARCAAAGVAPERLVFSGKQANAFHLARYPLADLFLDTAPYGAHTTASDALWMGVPVLTLSGRSFAARVCGSLVRAAGLPELICETAEDYVHRAVALAGDPTEIQRLKQKLEGGRADCTLFDMTRLAADLEDLYRLMCDQHAQGKTPQPDLQNLNLYKRVGIALDHEHLEWRAVEDYLTTYTAGIARIHHRRPVAADKRLWREEDVAAANAD